MMKNAVAIVTGASRGLGHEIARQLVQKNYHVIANYYNTPFPITNFLTSYFYKRFSQEKIGPHRNIFHEDRFCISRQHDSTIIHFILPSTEPLVPSTIPIPFSFLYSLLV